MVNLAVGLPVLVKYQGDICLWDSEVGEDLSGGDIVFAVEVRLQFLERVGGEGHDYDDLLNVVKRVCVRVWTE